MKKFLSILLALIFAVNVFSIEVGAADLNTYEEIKSSSLKSNADIVGVYKTVFEQYIDAMNNNYYRDYFDGYVDEANFGEFINFELLSASRYYDDFYIYYDELDLNYDGVPELLIGAGEEVNDITKYDIFTVHSGKVVRLFGEENIEIGYRMQFQVLKNDIVKFTGVGGYNTYGYTFYRLPDNSGRFEVVEDIYHDGYEDEYFKFENDSEIKITKNEFNSIINKYPEEKNYNWKKLTKDTLNKIKITPAGYNFLEDSYHFENYGDSISKKCFTTIFGEDNGKLLYKKKKNAGGLCFGMAYTTASIYNDLPHVNRISCVDGLSVRLCNNIRDIDKKSVVVIKDNAIKIIDYIKYSYIYQYSSEVAESIEKTWDDVDGLKRQITNALENDKIFVTITLVHCVKNEQGEFESDSAHEVLAVGMDGDDILIDDPNNTKDLERLSFSGNEWEYSGAWTKDGVNSKNSNFAYQTDFYRPFQLLSTGTTTVVSSSNLDNETCVEGMYTIDTDKHLLSVGGDNYSINAKEYLSVMTDASNVDSDADSADDLYWITKGDEVSVSSNGNNECNVEIASDGKIIGASIFNKGSVTVSCADDSVITNTIPGDKVEVSVESTHNNDIVTKMTGVAVNGTVEAEVDGKEVTVSGLKDINVTYEFDDGKIEDSFEISSSGESVTIETKEESLKEEHYHTVAIDEAVEPTCTDAGLTKGSHCLECGAVIETQRVVPAKGHSQISKVSPATTKANGEITYSCSLCGAKTANDKVVYYPKTITLSTSKYTYDGKVKKPTVKVVDSNGKTISSSNYTVTYPSGRKNVGKYTVKITFKGNYSGTVSKTFTIAPKSTTISKLTAAKKGFKVAWKKQSSQTTGYQIRYSTSSKMTKAKTVTVTKNSTTSKSISKLSAKKKYYVQIRTYKTVSGQKYYSSWSKAKSVKTK